MVGSKRIFLVHGGDFERYKLRANLKETFQQAKDSLAGLTPVVEIPRQDSPWFNLSANCWCTSESQNAQEPTLQAILERIARLEQQVAYLQKQNLELRGVVC